MRTTFPLYFLSLSLLHLLLSCSANAISTHSSGIPNIGKNPSKFRSPLDIPRGGTGSNAQRRRRPNDYQSFLGWREKLEELGDNITAFIERKTFFSRELMPRSEADSEWAAFLKGWLLVVLPIPQPLMFLALVAYSTTMSMSLWDDEIKRKYIVGLYHGVFVSAVLLHELHEKIEAIAHPRQLMILCNVATNLFLGKMGRFKPTKFLMDTSTFGTLFYILYQYFDTPAGESSAVKWYR